MMELTEEQERKLQYLQQEITHRVWGYYKERASLRRILSEYFLDDLEEWAILQRIIWDLDDGNE